MKIENISINKLIPYAKNSRSHSSNQINQIAASIKEFGFTNPVLIDSENIIIAGHGRVMAGNKLSMEEIPCIRLGHLTKAQKQAYIIADNKLALNATWDEEMLKVELDELKALDFDLDFTGFDSIELDNLFPEEKNYNDKNKEIDINLFDDEMILKFKFNSVEYTLVRNKLSEIEEKPETALLKLLGIDEPYE